MLLRGNNRRTTGVELAKLPLVTEPNGAVLTVGELGTVRDEFVDSAAMSRINRRPALALTVQRSTSEDLFVMIDSVKEYMATARLPAGYELMSWSDESVEVRSRLDLLVRNGSQGLVIVLVLLMLFLDARLAFWVALGIPFSLLAAGTFLYLTGQTLNLISMFAFVMALGIVVDDAIVVGENIFAHRQMGKPYVRAAIDGTVEVIPSVTTAVLTTVVAFSPLLFVTGTMGKFTAVMPAAIIAMLIASLIECVTILPCHLAHENNLLFRVIGFRVFRLPLGHGADRLVESPRIGSSGNVCPPCLPADLASGLAGAAGRRMRRHCGLVADGRVDPFRRDEVYDFSPVGRQHADGIGDISGWDTGECHGRGHQGVRGRVLAGRGENGAERQADRPQLFSTGRRAGPGGVVRAVRECLRARAATREVWRSSWSAPKSAACTVRRSWLLGVVSWA